MAYARREVILSAGAIRSPAILQLSGIGDAELLNGLGIEVLLDLKGVGRNLQEQTNSGMTAFGNARFAEEFGGGGPETVRFQSMTEVHQAYSHSSVACPGSRIPKHIRSIREEHERESHRDHRELGYMGQESGA